MKAVWKFAIPDEKWGSGAFGLESTFGVSVAINKIVHAGMQNGILCIWAEVRPDVPAPVRKDLIIYGTGHPITPEEEHLFTIPDGLFVWHLYRIPSSGKTSRPPR